MTWGALVEVGRVDKGRLASPCKRGLPMCRRALEGMVVEEAGAATWVLLYQHAPKECALQVRGLVLPRLPHVLQRLLLRTRHQRPEGRLVGVEELRMGLARMGRQWRRRNQLLSNLLYLRVCQPLPLAPIRQRSPSNS